MKTIIKIFALPYIAAVFSSVFAGVNESYANCDIGGGNFKYAPDSIVVGNTWKYKSVASDDEYRNLGWWPVVDIKPIAQDGYIQTPIGWEKVSHDNIREEIELVDSGVTDDSGDVVYTTRTNHVHYNTYTINRVYSLTKEKSVYVVADLFYWAKLNGKDAVIEEMLKNSGMYTIAVTTQYVESGNESFDSIIESIRNSGILSENEISSALDYAKKEQ